MSNIPWPENWPQVWIEGDKVYLEDLEIGSVRVYTPRDPKNLDEVARIVAHLRDLDLSPFYSSASDFERKKELELLNTLALNS